MDVDVAVFYLLRVDAYLLGIGLEVFESQRGRLLHHVAEVAGEGEGAFALADAGLDEEDFATHLCPGQTRDNAYLGFLAAALAVVDGQAEDVLQFLHTH